jgi:hypothetical protein
MARHFPSFSDIKDLLSDAKMVIILIFCSCVFAGWFYMLVYLMFAYPWFALCVWVWLPPVVGVVYRRRERKESEIEKAEQEMAKTHKI